jgi:hypothetical protein
VPVEIILQTITAAVVVVLEAPVEIRHLVVVLVAPVVLVVRAS